MTAASAGRFLLHCMGRLKVTQPGSGETILFRSRKAEAMGAILILSRGPISRERLAALLWSTRGENQARGSLRQVLTELRSSPIGGEAALRIDRREVEANDNAFTTDVETILSAARAALFDEVAAALRDFDGRILDGLDGIDEGLEDWLRAQRERLRSQLLDGLAAACVAPPDDRALDKRRAILSALQRIDAADDNLCRLALDLDRRAGDMATLHRRYRTYEATLRKEYGTAPPPETQVLFQQSTAMRPLGEIADPGRPGTPVAGSEPPILALPPLALLAGGEQEELVARVCHAELEIALGGVSDLRLLSLPDETTDAALQAACQGTIASYRLHGTMRSVDDHLHLFWKLTRISDHLQIWSSKMVVDQRDVGAAVDDFVGRVAGAVLPAVQRDIDAGVDPHTRSGDGGYMTYLRGRARLLSATTLEDCQAAAALFERAIEQGPRLVNAYLALAALCNTDFGHRSAGHDTAPLRQRAYELYKGAARLDPASAQARGRLGWCHMRRGDHRQARQRFEEALALNSTHADCLNEIGFGYLHLGDLGRAEELLAKAFALNPFPDDTYFSDMGILHMLRGNPVEAEDLFEAARGQSLHYRGFRVANRALIGKADAASTHRLAEFRRDFRAIWQPARAPTDHDMLTALLEFVPLQDPDAIALLTRGLRAAGLDI